MTQSSLQTQCPNCQTRFRVTEEQLGIAKGQSALRELHEGVQCH